MQYQYPDRLKVMNIPAIRIAVVLSLLLHASALVKLQFHPDPGRLSDGVGERKEGGSLRLRLAPVPKPLPSTPPPATPAAPEAPRKAAPRPPPPPVRQSPPPAPPAPVAPAAPQVMTSPSPAAPPVAPPRPQPPGDMLAMLEARRRARGEQPQPPSPPVESENARRDRELAESLSTRNTQVFGYDPRQGGGVFQVEHLGYDYAEFLFFGWNKDIKRRTKQSIEVRLGNNPNIRIAVVRKMISIIREYEPNEFTWESRRLGRSVVLSSRAADNAGLEDFMMLEFFERDRIR